MTFPLLIACAKVCADLTIGKTPVVVLSGDKMWSHNDAAIVEASSPVRVDGIAAYGAADIARLAARFSDPSVTVTDAGHLLVKEAGVRATVKRLSDDAALASPFIEPTSVPAPAVDLSAALSSVLPFVSADATRPWSIGVLLHTTYVYATNNVCIARAPSGVSVPTPVMITSRVLSVLDTFPSVRQVWQEENAVVFAGDGFRVRAARPTIAWPPVESLFSNFPTTLTPVPREYAQAIASIASIADGRVTFEDGRVVSGSKMVDVEYEGDTAGIRGTYTREVAKQVAEHALVASTVVTDVRGKQSPVVYFEGEGGLQGLARGITA